MAGFLGAMRGVSMAIYECRHLQAAPQLQVFPPGQMAVFRQPHWQAAPGQDLQVHELFFLLDMMLFPFVLVDSLN
jgi:hypothetical protein